MAALSAHLSRPDDHARLPLRPDCPICQGERVLGPVASRPLVSQRTGAGMAVILLAVTTPGPVAAAFASEPPRFVDSTTDSGDTTGGGQSQFAPDDRVLSGDFDPIDGAPDLPDDPEPADTVAPPSAQPAPDTDRAPAEAVRPGAPPDAQPQPAAPNASAAPLPSSATPDDPPPAAPAVQPPSPKAAASQHASLRGSSARTLVMSHRTQLRTARPPSTATVAPAPKAPAQAQPSAAVVPVTRSDDHADPGDRAHTVHAGESLWSISSDRLGPGAAPAQIAREVHRLWQLNADRIGTGDPDLLMVGTRLVLR